jgi:hypothetical protein
LPVYTFPLGLLATACVPDPIDPFAPTRELPTDTCRASQVRVASGRWLLDSVIKGSSSTDLAGELAAAELEITLSDWPSQHLLDMRLELTVLAGQSLSGQALVLRRDSEPLQEATLVGPQGNEAHFDLELPRDVCGTPCTFSLTLSGPPADANVPVPLKLSGKLTAFVDAARETRLCAEDELRVVVIDAP